MGEEMLNKHPSACGRAIQIRVWRYSSVQNALPSLSASDIETAMRFYREHRDEINCSIAENNVGEDIPYDER